MAGLVGSTINGIGNLVSGGTWQLSGQQVAQNEFNALEAQKQRDWEERMSNTAYQRAVSDMRQAGLNPYLAYQQGGASTPQGSFAQNSGLEASRNKAKGIIDYAVSFGNLLLSAAKLASL